VFDLKRGPLQRVTLVRLTDTDQRLFIVAHLSILDGVSVYQLLPVELATLYKAFSAGKASPLPDFRFIRRLCLLATPVVKKTTNSKAVGLLERTAGRRPSSSSVAGSPPELRGANVPRNYPTFAVSQSLTQALKNASRGEGVTFFTILVASLGALLCRYTRQVDIAIGTPSPAGRKRSETQALLGYFLNPVALRLDLDGIHDP